MSPTLYIPALLGTGLLVLLVAWLPLALRRAPLSLPIVCVGIGALLGTNGIVAANVPRPEGASMLIERGAELVVIVSLMGAGLKIDHPFSFSGWKLTWRMLAVAMPVSIALFLLFGTVMLGLALPARCRVCFGGRR